MQDAKHILASKTFWVHILTLVLAIAATCQGDEWIAQHPEWMQFLVYFSAFMGIVLRMLTTQPVKVKPDGPSDNKPTRVLLIAAAFLGIASTANAQRPGDPYRMAGLPTYSPADKQAHDALDEVNEARRSWGLRPFLRDRNLTRGALHVAKWRAERLVEGHTCNDFGGLPRGSWADGSGCGACTTFWGWFCCCTEADARYAGAAWCWGRDGQRYQQIFIRR